MNISSVIVAAQPARRDAVQAALAAWPGIEVHASTPDGRLLVTVEADDDAGSTACFGAISGLDGVMSVALVYHQCEPDADAPCAPFPVLQGEA